MEKHDFMPMLGSNVAVKDDVEGCLQPVLARHVEGLMEGKEVKWWVEESERLKRFVDEKNLVERRLKEFESAMQCLLKYLEDGGDDVEGVKVFRFDGGFDWKRIHCLIKRECRRLEDGLPIYAYRSDILQEIHYQQVCLSFYCDFNSFYYTLFSLEGISVFYKFITLFFPFSSCWKVAITGGVVYVLTV